MTPFETVQGIYQAFGRGDVPAILATVADDVAWESWADNSAQKAGVRWMTPRHGKAGVLEFFQLVAQFQIHEFKVLSIMGNERQVAAEFVIEATPIGWLSLPRRGNPPLDLWSRREGHAPAPLSRHCQAHQGGGEIVCRRSTQKARRAPLLMRLSHLARHRRTADRVDQDSRRPQGSAARGTD